MAAIICAGRAASSFSRRGIATAMTAWLILALIAAGSAVASTCAPAATQGTAPSDYQDYCWLDFSGYSDALAQAAGQPFNFALPDGSSLSFILHVSTNEGNPALAAVATPSWSGAAIGQSGFNGIPGNPVLYETISGSTVQVVLSNITVTPPAGSGATASYDIVAADGESTNQGESLSFTTTGTAWTQLAQIPYGTGYPTVTGVGTATVTETGVAGTVGAFAFGSFNNPTQISSTLVGGGLQGAMFAIRYASVALTAQFNGARANASDQFTYSIKNNGGQALAKGTTTGAALGPFPPALVPTIAAGYPFVVNEVLAPGSASTLANYAISLTCTNQSTGSSSTVLPVNQAGNTYTFPRLQFGDALSCIFTNTANRADVIITKTGPASVNAGAPVSYTLVVNNQGPSAANGILVQDPAVANFSAATVACTTASGGAVCPNAAATTVAALQGAGIAIPTLPNGGAVTLLVSGTAGINNIVNVASLVPPAGLINSNPSPSATARTTVTASADMASTLTFPPSVNAGQPVAGTVLYTNNGPSTASGTTFGLTLSANLAAPPTLSGLPAGATYSYIAATGVVTFTGMPIALASGSNVGPIAVNYIQPPSGTSVVTATVNSTTFDPNLANNTAAATIAGVPAADVASKVTFPATVNAGQPVSGTVLYTNNGPSTASGATFGLTLSANLAVPPTLSGLPAGATYTYVASSGVVTLAGMPTTLASGSNVGPITVSYTQPPSGVSAVSATVNSATLDPNLANNTATATITGVVVADVASKVTCPANVNAGQPVSGTVLFTNNGPSTASGTTFGVTLPANLAVPPTLSGLPAGATYSYLASSGVVTFTGMPTTLTSGSNVGPITVSYIQPPSGNSVVSATVTSATLDPNLANNTAAATITGVAVADVASKVTFPAHVNAGQSVSGTVLYTNEGPSTASGTSFSLTVAANLTVPPTLNGLPAGATYTYVASTGVVTFTGMPTTLASGSNVGPITVTYTQPPSGTSVVTATVNTTTLDPDPANGTAKATITGAPAELTGTVFIDNNQDAVFDSGDTPIAGVAVQLFEGTRLVATAVSSTSGKYAFTGQASGAYSVAVTPPHGYLSDTPSPVAVTLSSGAPTVVNFGVIPAGADGALVLTKTTPLVDISAGQSVPYTITAVNSKNTPIVNSNVVDLIPAGFHFRAGSGSVNGKKQDPTVNGRELTWTHLAFAPGEKKTFTLVLTVGAGVTGGEFVNQASAFNALTHALISNLATATVRIVGDPTFDCPDLIGKVFDDANANGVEDPGEKGIAGVRLITAQGLLVTTDAQGRYHIACPVHPDAAMGTNFVVKVDERTLPSGYRLTTDNPETVRLTAGKVSKLNFGATIHRVVRVEVNDGAFDGNELRPAVSQRLDLLVTSLKDQASIVRLAYAAADESDATVASRLQGLKAALAALWKSHDCHYPLRVEEDIVRSARPHDGGGKTP